jgi:malate synthase
VPLNHLMEDAATAEISRTQVWQWRHHGATLADGRPISAELCRQVIGEELAKTQAQVGAERFERGKYREAAQLMSELIEAEPYVEFLTLPAYERVVSAGG